MILRIIFCTYETWCLALRQEHRLQNSEHKLLQRVFLKHGQSNKLQKTTPQTDHL